MAAVPQWWPSRLRLYHVIPRFESVVPIDHAHSWTFMKHMNWIVLQSCKASLHWSFLVMKDLSGMDMCRLSPNNTQQFWISQVQVKQTVRYVFIQDLLVETGTSCRLKKLWLMTAAISSWKTMELDQQSPSLLRNPPMDRSSNHVAPPPLWHPHVCRFKSQLAVAKNLRNTTFYGIKKTQVHWWTS